MSEVLKLNQESSAQSSIIVNLVQLMVKKIESKMELLAAWVPLPFSNIHKYQQLSNCETQISREIWVYTSLSESFFFFGWLVYVDKVVSRGSSSPLKSNQLSNPLVQFQPEIKQTSQFDYHRSVMAFIYLLWFYKEKYQLCEQQRWLQRSTEHISLCAVTVRTMIPHLLC